MSQLIGYKTNKFFKICEMKLHIGQEIEKKFQESGLKLSAFADAIDTGERNVYSIFKREDISADMLQKISKTLKFNFFSLYEQNISEFILEDESVQYKKRENRISIEIKLNAKIETYVQKFPELLIQFKETASIMGFDLE